MDQDGRIFLLALQKFFFHHPRIARAIIERTGTAQAAFLGDRQSLRDCFGENEELFLRFLANDGWARFERELKEIVARGGRITGLGADDYPQYLLEIHDPPPSIIIIGEAGCALSMPSVAIVGSRLASRRGMDIAAEMAEGLAAAGVAVVSGMAYGIDAAAHRGAIQGGGVTIAVQGCGYDIDYPASHAKLARDIERHGLRISEFPPGEPPHPSNFPQRNRIISGLSLATVVVEAAERSGSLITARYALEQGREVFAVPGPAGSSNARGVHKLIRDGAALVESADDVLALISPLVATGAFFKKPGHLKNDWDMDSPLLRAIATRGEASVDDIVSITGLHASEVLAKLSELSLEGIACELPGRRWRLKGK